MKWVAEIKIVVQMAVIVVRTSRAGTSRNTDGKDVKLTLNEAIGRYTGGLEKHSSDRNLRTSTAELQSKSVVIWCIEVAVAGPTV